MPIYEYACRACGHAFETMQKASEPRLTVCPACGEPQLKKLLSAPVFRLKGSGWYETDFKSGDKKRNLAGETAAETGSGGAKSDSGASPAADAASKDNGKSSGDAGGKSAGSKSSDASSTASKAAT